MQKDLVAKKLSKEEKECHQVFRLTSDGKDATYEWYKDRVEERAENTCLWFLQHEKFQKWMNQEAGPLLVTADPGCGKSVLAKYLIDHGLPQLATICYFFFKDQDQNTSRQALCALLHQLFSQKPALIKHAMPQFNKNGVNLSQATSSLWRILQDTIKDPEAGSVIIVIDALDECAESEFVDLIRNVGSQFHNSHPDSKLKYLLTCRPYEQITSQFHSLLESFPDIRIPGEEESEAISQEIGHVITSRTDQLSAQKNLTSEIKSKLAARLRSISHRTYLWVYLIFKHLEEGIFKKTLKGIESTIATLPSSINEAYERILNKTKERPIVQRALSIVLAANRPLTLAEMNIALSVVETSQNTYDLDLEDTESFKLRLRSLCGLFIAIHNNNIYFLHQTAKEFLLAELSSSLPTPVSSSWQHSITLRHAHATLAELCVIYLDLLNSNDMHLEEMRFKNGRLLDFLDYSAKNWGTHFYEASIADNAAILLPAMRICDPNSRSYSFWFKKYREYKIGELPENAPELILASYYGLTALARLCIEKGCYIEAADGNYAPLHWAIFRGHNGVIELLLGMGACVEAKDNKGLTPLLHAIHRGYEHIIKLLLKQGANIEAKDNKGLTPLLHAIHRGHEDIVKLLLKQGANIEAKDNNGLTPLSQAAYRGDENIAKLLLEKEADIEAKDNGDLTPLLQAASRGHEDIVQLLLEKGADTEPKDSWGWTPLLHATYGDREDIIKLLLEKGADIEAKNSWGWTPLLRAVYQGQEDIIELLLEKGADIEAKDKKGLTPLLQATYHGHEGIIKLLLDKGADIEAMDNEGLTPVSQAISMGYEDIVDMLLEKGANYPVELLIP